VKKWPQKIAFVIVYRARLKASWDTNSSETMPKSLKSSKKEKIWSVLFYARGAIGGKCCREDVEAWWYDDHLSWV
jgi:hypothetical protein